MPYTLPFYRYHMTEWYRFLSHAFSLRNAPSNRIQSKTLEQTQPNITAGTFLIEIRPLKSPLPSDLKTDGKASAKHSSFSLEFEKNHNG
jgi:hypothetical protein